MLGEEVKKFKLREEKHVVAEIEMMAWSPTMDLLALANVNGEILVNRLSWQRVWSLAPPTESDRIRGLSWRPDGKVIAVGYASGKVRICDVEKGDLVYAYTIHGGVTCLEWLEQSKQLTKNRGHYAEDNSSEYLPVSQQLNSLYSENPLSKEKSGLEAYERFRSLTSQKELNLLVIGTDLNEVNLFAYGVFPTGLIDLSSDDTSESQIVDSAIVSPDLNTLSVVVKCTNAGRIDFKVKTLDTALLVARHEEIRHLAAKYVMIASAQMELRVIIQQMCEAWEEILREMDSKLLRFAQSKKQQRGNGSVSNDFLELLLFGTTSLELQSFLLQDLTDKGLKKLGFSIENSYSNIQKLVVRQLQRVSQNVTCHLSDLHGMSQWYDKYGVLGLNKDAVERAVKVGGAFAVSASELQQVIDTSIKNFKAFFRWLYIAILRLSNENPPTEINKMTQHDITFVAEFLRDNFTHLLGDEEGPTRAGPSGAARQPSRTSGFKLEKVGQYLKNEDLVQPPNYNENPWVQFLSSTSFHKDSKVLYPSMQGKSMLQRRDMLYEAVEHAVLEPARVIGASMRYLSSFHLFRASEDAEGGVRPPKVCQFTDEERGFMWVAYVRENFPCDTLYLLRHPVREASDVQVACVKVGRLGDSSPDEQFPDKPPCEKHLFLDFAVFTPQALTLMLREEGEEDTTLLVQLQLSTVLSSYFTAVEPAHFNEHMQLKTLDVGPLLNRASVNYQTNVMGYSIAVGGIRTTASVLLKSQRRVRLFLLEEGDGDDDDEDEDEDNSKGESSSQLESTTETAKEEGVSKAEDDDKENITDK